MIENLVGRSQSFWKFALPLAKDFFPSLKNVSLEDFVRAVNIVEPGYIRVDADEVTYNIHVLIRLELELAIFREVLTVDDLPSAWNEKMKQYLDIVPPDYSLGVMQDVHWSAGMFGYFPTYTLGNIYAAQIFEKINEDIPGLHADFEKGCFDSLKKWLNEKIHEQGQSLGANELILNLTSKQPDSKSFMNYCNEKYGQIYDL
jgi:carboxypeptidase Taq